MSKILVSQTESIQHALMPAAVEDFYRRTAQAKKILVVDLGFLGDTVHLIPALWEIRRHYPQAVVQVLTTPIGTEVLSLVSCVDRTWAFPLTANSPAWWRHWGILWALRRRRFDIAFNFSGADRTIWTTALSGARLKLAHQGAREHFWNRWLIPHWVARRDRSQPVYEQKRQVLAACGFSLEPVRFNLCLPETAVAWARLQAPEGAIHCSISASTHLKEWPFEHWTSLAGNLLRNSSALTVIASGSDRPREQERLQRFAGRVNHPRLKLLPPGLTVAQLAAVLQRCALHIGGDSGVLHLAMALGVPTLGIFREYSGLAEWTPQGEKHRVLTACCECADQKKPPCQNLAQAKCLMRIKPEQVLLLVRSMLASPAPT